jgi:hypothetical protein
VKYGAVNVWPRPFEHKGGSIDADVDSSFLRSVAEGALGRWIAHIGNASNRTLLE